MIITHYILIIIKGNGFQDLIYMKKYGKVFTLLIGRTESLVISDPELLKQVMVKDFSAFTNRRVSTFITSTLCLRTFRNLSLDIDPTEVIK